MCTMKLVAKLINFKQIEPSKTNILTQKYKFWNMKTTGSARVYNRCRVFCEIASLNNYIIIH